MSATVTISTANGKGEYSMFDLRSLDTKGAVLEGPLFLEVGETIKLRVNKAGKSIELAARVHEVAEDKATMTVRFVDVSPELAAFVTALAPITQS